MTRPPPPRSRRAGCPHRALQEDAPPPSRLGTPPGDSRRRLPDEVRARPPDVVPPGPTPGPRRALPLPAALAPLAQEPPRPGAERLPTGSVPRDARGVVVAPPRGLPRPDQGLPPAAPPRPAPRAPPLARVSPRLARRPALAVGLAGPGAPPATLQAQNADAGGAGLRRPGERQAPRLARGPRQPEPATPLAPLPGDPRRGGRRRPRADALLRVTPPARVAPTSWRAHCGPPPVQRLVPVPSGQEGCTTPPLRGPGGRRAHRPLRVPPPRLPPWLEAPPPRAIVEAFFPPPPHPARPEVVQAPRAVRLPHHVIPPTWALEGPPGDGRHRAHRRTIPSATAPTVLRVAGWPSPHDGAGPERSRARGASSRAPRARPWRDGRPPDAFRAGRLPLPARHAGVPALAAMARSILRPGAGHPRGGRRAEVPPALCENRRGAPRRAGAAPMGGGRLGLRRAPRPAGGPGFPGPLWPVPVAWAGAVSRSAPAPCARPSRLRGRWAELPAAAAAARLTAGRADLTGRPGPPRGSHVPGVALPPGHALGGPRRPRGDRPGRGPVGEASGAFNPSPAAGSLVTGRSPASGRALVPTVCGSPWGRVTGVVRLWPPSPRRHAVGGAGEA